MHEDPHSRGSAPPWSGETRSFVSLLLFVHLFALIVAATSYTRPSDVQQRLHALFAPYLRNLHLTAYPNTYPFARYYLTHALPTDVDFACEVSMKPAAGGEQTVTLPPQGLWPGIRQRRYQAMLNAAGTLADPEADEDLGAILPRTLAGAVLRRHEATQGTLRLQAHYLPELEAMGAVVAGRRTPPVETTFEAQVFISGGSVEMLKKSTALEVAPVETRRGATGATRRGPAPAPADKAQP